MSKTTVCGLKYLNFLAQVCRTFFWQTKSAFPRLIFPPLSRGAFFFVCRPCLLTLWQAESPRIVWEEWLFVVPTCCHCGFDCLSGQHGCGTQPFAHSHPCGWTFLLARLPESAAGFLWAAAIRMSDWVCFWKAEQHYDQAWRLETICADFFPVEWSNCCKKKKKDPAQALVCRNFAKTG